MTDIALVVRSPLGAATLANEIRRMIGQLDRNQPVAAVQTMDERLTESVSKPRMTAALLGSFAWLAVVFGMVGVYGVMGCRVRWQIRELALRQALGAQRRDVIGHVLRQALGMVLPGCVLGLAGSLALGRISSALLFEVPANDPRTLSAVAAGLAVAALAACWIPAMRAARADPIVTLRQD
jgi:ABC-type antimicrobial peptide transport system permease subunit